VASRRQAIESIASPPPSTYALNNPDRLTGDLSIRATLTLSRNNFPTNITDLRLDELTVFAVRADGAAQEVTIASVQHTVGGQVLAAGPVTTIDGIVGTRRPNGAPWQAFRGTDPSGTWEPQLQDSPQTRDMLTRGVLQDLALDVTLTGTTAPWPT